MRLTNVFCYALLSLPSCTEAVPYKIQNGKLQRLRRRAVDYPLHPQNVPGPRLELKKMRKRALPYSVVPVDGGSTTTPPPVQTVYRTVTDDPTPTPVTEIVTETGPIATAIVPIETLMYTTVVTEGMTEKTIVVTATQTPPVTTATPAAVTVVQVQTVTPSAASVSYYDDGQWHTFYPIKTFTVLASVPTASPTFNDGLWHPSSTTYAPAPTSTKTRHKPAQAGGQYLERSSSSSYNIISWEMTKRALNGVKRLTRFIRVR